MNPLINMRIESSVVQATSRKLKATWTFEAAKDLLHMHGVDWNGATLTGPIDFVPGKATITGVFVDCLVRSVGGKAWADLQKDEGELLFIGTVYVGEKSLNIATNGDKWWVPIHPLENEITEQVLVELGACGQTPRVVVPRMELTIEDREVIIGAIQRWLDGEMKE